MSTPDPRMDARDWSLLVFLSVLWGASFFFAGAAIRELPPLTIVLVRVALAALVLLPVVMWRRVPMPRTPREWWPFAVMGVLNNIIPSSLLIGGQMFVSSGLASVLNATTPLFTVLVMAAFGEERLTAGRVAGVILGVVGVAVLRGWDVEISGTQTLGIVMCLGAALSYGFSGLWARRNLTGVAPLTSATGQLTASAVLMVVIAGVVERPWQLAMPSGSTILALVGLATLATALAYIVFFAILVRSGATNVMLVTLLIPITAITLGVLVLGEPLTPRHILGGLVIASGLLILDGRVPAMLARRGAATGR